MKKFCLSLLFLLIGTQVSLGAEIAEKAQACSANEKLELFEDFTIQTHIFDYLCEQCKMPPNEIICEVYTKSITLEIPHLKALESIMTIFHLNVIASVKDKTIEELSLLLEKTWDKISSKKK